MDLTITADCKNLAPSKLKQWKTTIDLPRMNVIIFPASASLPLGSNKVNQLWFSTVQLLVARLLQSAVAGAYELLS